MFPGWKPPPLPPIAPDGLPTIPQTPRRLHVIQAPTLCDQGPCIFLHTVEMPYDVTKPMDGSEQREYRATVRTCYPHPGIEIPMNDVTILQCNRWTPSDPIRNAGIERNRKAYLITPEGQRYASDLAAWQADQDSIEQAAIDAADPVIDPTPNPENNA